MYLVLGLKLHEHLRKWTYTLIWLITFISPPALIGSQFKIDLLKHPFINVAVMNSASAFLFLMSPAERLSISAYVLLNQTFNK